MAVTSHLREGAASDKQAESPRIPGSERGGQFVSDHL